MRAVHLTGFGGFDKLDYREDVAVPAQMKGEVLIKVGACGVNNTDLWTREGAYGGSMGEQDLHLASVVGSERDGGFAEFVAIPANNALPIDSQL